MQLQLHPWVTDSDARVSTIAESYLSDSYELGKLIAEAGHVCINGAGANGAMGALNKGLVAAKGRVIGVSHESFVDGDIESFADHEGFELVVARGDTLAERKRLLAEPADALCVRNLQCCCYCLLLCRGTVYLRQQTATCPANPRFLADSIALPGGTGTWEELWEVACLNALGLLPTNRPVAVVNTDGFYAGFQTQIRRAFDDGLLHKDPEEIVNFAETPSAALAFVLAGIGKPSKAASVVVGKPSKL